MESVFYRFETLKLNIMNYQEIENKLVEFAHKKEGKDYPIHEVDIGTAVDFAIELVKNCSIPVVVGQSEQLPDANKRKCNCSNAKDRLDCGFECYNK